MEPRVLFVMLICLFINTESISGAHSDRVLLKDVQAITLHQGKMTNARRSSAVPQLKCVGGTASCVSKPQVVQCQNRGFDGYDVQWECKADMDNSYRFGNLQVSCEGYDYPDDPYILRGSCGLEYTIDLTEEGWERKKSGNQQAGGHHYADDFHDRSNYPHSYSKKASSIFQDLFYLAIIAGIIYIIYKTCIATPTIPGDAPPPYEAHDGFGPRQHPSAPPSPPYGFRQDYMPGGSSCSDGTTNSGSQTYTPPGTNTGGGFWSGAFSGGLMGYLLGRNTGYNTGYQRPYTGWGRNTWGNGWGTGWGSGWGSGGGWGSGTYTTTTSHRGSGFSSAPRSSGTRTASGFASTSRR